MIKEKECISALDKYQASNYIPMDQIVVSIPEYFLKGHGWKGDNDCFHSGIICFMVESFSMMQQLMLYGLKMKPLLVLKQLSWQRFPLKNDFEI